MPNQNTPPQNTEGPPSRPTKPEETSIKRSGSKLPIALLYIAIGILIGFLATQNLDEYLPKILPTLMVIMITLFVVIIVLLIALPRIINYFIKRYTGKDGNVETTVEDIQTKSNRIADVIASMILARVQVDAKAEQNIRNDLPVVLNFLVFSRLRGAGIRLMLGVFVAIGGLMGTILLYNQNQLLQKQNALITNQNEKIDNQILLDEASRRSSLNILMDNVLNKIDEELKVADREGKPRKLSPQLIGRIASLSQAFRPYRFMEDGKMTEKAFSPERGNLLLALVNSGLDSLTLDTIFDKTIFQGAYLRDADLRGANLLKVDLSEADLSKAYLSKADLSSANFHAANLHAANLRDANLYGVELSGADLSDANLSGAILQDAVLQDAYLYGARLYHANLQEAILVNADLIDADLRRADLLGTILYGAKVSSVNWYELLQEDKGITIGVLDIKHRINPKKQIDALNREYYLVEEIPKSERK